MKIRDIIQETEFKVRKRKKPYTFQDDDDIYGPSSSDRNPEDGAYSTGEENPEDPHEFIKRPHKTTKTKKDAYFQYVKRIKELKDQGYENRFFPRVREVVIRQDPRGNERTKYTVEKLQNPADYSIQAIIAMIKRLVVEKYRGEWNYSSVKEAWSQLARTLDTAVTTGNTSNIQDLELADALQQIHDLYKEHPSWDVDLHSGNIKIRGTAQGPQLVLMDPLSDAFESIPTGQEIKYGAERVSQQPSMLAVQQARFKLGRDQKPQGAKLYDIYYRFSPSKPIGQVWAKGETDAKQRASAIKELPVYQLTAYRSEKGPAE